MDKKEKKDMTSKEAQAILQREKVERQNKCVKEIDKALEEYKCRIAVSMVVTANGNAQRIQVVAE